MLTYIYSVLCHFPTLQPSLKYLKVFVHKQHSLRKVRGCLVHFLPPDFLWICEKKKKRQLSSRRRSSLSIICPKVKNARHMLQFFFETRWSILVVENRLTMNKELISLLTFSLLYFTFTLYTSWISTNSTKSEIFLLQDIFWKAKL